MIQYLFELVVGLPGRLLCILLLTVIHEPHGIVYSCVHKYWLCGLVAAYIMPLLSSKLTQFKSTALLCHDLVIAAFIMEGMFVLGTLSHLKCCHYLET